RASADVTNVHSGCCAPVTYPVPDLESKTLKHNTKRKSLWGKDTTSRFTLIRDASVVVITSTQTSQRRPRVFHSRADMWSRFGEGKRCHSQTPKKLTSRSSCMASPGSFSQHPASLFS